MDALRRLWQRLKARGRRVQAAAVVAGLWVMYWVGLGTTRLLATVFRPDLLSGSPEAPSYWKEAQPADYDPARLPFQS